MYIYAYRGPRRNAGRHRAATLFASRCIFLQARTHDAAPSTLTKFEALFFASTQKRRPSYTDRHFTDFSSSLLNFARDDLFESSLNLFFPFRRMVFLDSLLSSMILFVGCVYFGCTSMKIHRYLPNLFLQVFSRNYLI